MQRVYSSKSAEQDNNPSCTRPMYDTATITAVLQRLPALDSKIGTQTTVAPPPQLAKAAISSLSSEAATATQQPKMKK